MKNLWVLQNLQQTVNGNQQFFQKVFKNICIKIKIVKKKLFLPTGNATETQFTGF
jgi:hypothetical protein